MGYLNGPFAASFLLFSSFLQTVHMFNKICRWLDSNPGPQASEATALTSAPQPLPDCNHGYSLYFVLIQPSYGTLQSHVKLKIYEAHLL